MPPRRSARVAAVAEGESSALSPLPLPLVLHVFSLLPVDARARAACVCRGWRTTLLEASLWTRLNLSPSSGVRVRVTDAVLAGAAAKAGGQLAALNVRGCGVVSFDALLAVVRANGGALRKLRVGAQVYGTPQTLGAGHVERLLQVAPQLAACHADVLGYGSIADARRMLRNEPPFQLLRLRVLRITFQDNNDDEAPLHEVAADMAAHASLQRVGLYNAPLHTPAALDAVVDAALACQMLSLRLLVCRLSPASAPALARLLGGGSLTALFISLHGQNVLDGPSAALLGAALRANSTLTSLNLFHAGLWHDMDVAAALVSALAGHRSLRELMLAANDVDAAHGTAAGAALGALIAANAPALTKLDVSNNDLNDAALRLLFEALPHNTHLRELDVIGNDTSATFARDVLLPAVRANTGLRRLALTYRPEEGGIHVQEAQALVARRAAL